MNSLVFHPEAEAEVEDSADFYEGRRAGLGEEFRAEIEDTLHRIAATPTIFSPYKGGPVRRILLRRFPFGLYFVERGRAIHVLAVANQRRQPEYWLKRLGDI